MAIDERELFEAVQLDMSPAFRRRLERDLRAAASVRVDHEPDAPSAQARVVAHPTTRRRTWVTASAAALVLAAAIGITAIRLHERPGRDRVPTTPTVLTSTTSTTSTTATTAPQGLSGVPATAAASSTYADEWAAVDLGTKSLAGTFQQVTGDGPLFAWTSDISVSPSIPSDLYRSTDGTTWSQVPIPAGFSIVAATATSTHVALLGFVIPADATAAVDMVAMLSDDAGLTWRTIPFDVTLPRRKADATLVRPASGLIAAYGTTVVASFSTADGWDDNPDVIMDSTGSAIPSDRPLYVSVDDQRFEKVDGEPSPGPTVALSVSNGQFLVLATPPLVGGTTPAVLWQSNDGRLWTSLGSAPKAVPGATLGKLDDRYVVVPQCCDTVWISDDGTQWRSADFAGLLANAQEGSIFSANAVIGASGITVAGMYLPMTSTDIDYTKDGVIERLVSGSTRDIVLLDEATGAELGRVTTTPFDNGRVRALGDGKIDILDADGNVRTSFTAEEVNRAFNAAPSNRPYAGVILHSDDGSSWTSASIDAIAGGSPTGLSWIQSIGGATTVGAYVSTGDEAGAHLVVMVEQEHS